MHSVAASCSVTACPKFVARLVMGFLQSPCEKGRRMLSQSLPSIVQHRMAAVFAGSEASTHWSSLPEGQ